MMNIGLELDANCFSIFFGAIIMFFLIIFLIISSIVNILTFGFLFKWLFD